MLCSVLCKCGRAFQTKRCGIFHCKPCERSLHFGMTEWKERSICSALRQKPHALSAKFHFYHSYNSSSWYIIIPKQSWSATQNICDIVGFFFSPTLFQELWSNKRALFCPHSSFSFFFVFSLADLKVIYPPIFPLSTEESVRLCVCHISWLALHQSKVVKTDFHLFLKRNQRTLSTLRLQGNVINLKKKRRSKKTKDLHCNRRTQSLTT